MSEDDFRLFPCPKLEEYYINESHDFCTKNRPANKLISVDTGSAKMVTFSSEYYKYLDDLMEHQDLLISSIWKDAKKYECSYDCKKCKIF